MHSMSIQDITPATKAGSFNPRLKIMITTAQYNNKVTALTEAKWAPGMRFVVVDWDLQSFVIFRFSLLYSWWIKACLFNGASVVWTNLGFKFQKQYHQCVPRIVVVLFFIPYFIFGESIDKLFNLHGFNFSIMFNVATSKHQILCDWFFFLLFYLALLLFF
jgi:hypothetical protein